MIRCKRIYLPPDRRDGKRVLVERLWPRGVRKASVVVDLWLKEIAPSTALRRWFAHDPLRWEEFQTLYRAELNANQRPVAQLLDLAARNELTLLYASRDEPGNSAMVLQAYLQRLTEG